MPLLPDTHADPRTVDAATVHGGSPAAVLGAALDDRARGIVEAAYALLADRGLEGLTIRAVLGRTGLARRAFYERFSGKDDLVLAVFGHAIRMAALRYEEQVAAIADPLSRLRLVITSIALGTPPAGPARAAPRIGAQPGGRHGAAMSREHLRLAESRPAELQIALAPLLDLLVRLLSEGMAAGSVRTGSPERLATLVYNLVSTTIHAELIGRAPAADDPARRLALAHDLWEFCRRGITADG